MLAVGIYLLSYKEGSIKQYQPVWQKFLSFLSDNGVPQHWIAVTVACNYLAFEASVIRLQYRTVSGYRCALRLRLYWGCGFEVNSFVSDQCLKGLYN